MKFTGFARTTTVSVDGGSYGKPSDNNNPSGKSTVLNDNKNHSVSFKNVYTVGGKLTVKKHFNPNNIATAEKNQVTFALYKKLGATPNPTTDTKIQEIKYSAFSNGAYTFSNLEFGDYYVVETNQDVPNYNDATTYFVEEYTINDQGQAVKTRTPATGTSSGTTAEAEVGNASMSNPSVIDFTNTYTREAGSLQITKTLDDTNLTAEEKAEVAQKLSFAVKRGTTSIGSFTYKQLMDAVGTGTTGTITIGSYTGTVTKVDDDTYRVKIDGLPTGTYTVTETADVAGYSRESHAKNDADIATVQDPEGTSGSTTFAENGLGKVAFRNKYTPSGSLNIIKDWGPVLSNEYITELEQTLIYKVYEYDATKPNHLGNPVNKPGTESNEYRLGELSTGITVEANKKYIVVETNADVPGYIRTTVMYSVVDEANKTSEEKQAAREATQVTVSNATAADGVFTATKEDIVEQKKNTTFHFINSYLDRLGGDLNAFTTKEEIVIHSTVLKEDLGKAAALLLELATCPIFPDEEISIEKGVVIDEISSYKDSPADDVYDKFEETLLAGHPLGRPILGTAASVRKISAEELRAFVKERFTPGNMALAIVADIDEKKMEQGVLRLSEKVFDGSWSESPERILSPVETPALFKKTVDKRHHEVNAVIGGLAPSLYDQEGRFAAILLANIVGGPASNSKLNDLLRERNGWVYGVETSYTQYSDTGVMAISMGCDRSNLEKCMRGVDKVIKRIQDELLSDSAMRAAKKQLLGQLAISSDNGETQCLSMGKSLISFGDVSTDQQNREAIEAVTADRIRESARRIFSPETLSSLIFL